MKRNILITILLIVVMSACRKETGRQVEAIVVEPFGCTDNSWLVSIVNPNPSRHSFLCASLPTAGTTYNCSNSAMMELPGRLAVAGKRIVFSVESVLPSCLSLSTAPSLLLVKDLEEQ